MDGTTDAPVPPLAPAQSHGPTWVAWGALLVLTVAMLAIGHPLVLLAGITAKAAIICFWFMHLRGERWDLTATVLVGAFATAAVLFGLIAVDGMAM
jgi:hypothetical protein